MELSGTVTSQTTGEAVSEIDVGLSEEYATTTDARGQFSFRVKPGTYTIHIDARGFKRWTKEVILDWEETNTKHVTVKLSPALKKL